MKRICFIGFGLFTVGGAQRVTISLANDLCERYKVHVLSLCEIPSEKPFFVDKRVEVHTFGMPLNLRAKQSLKLFFKIRKFLIENKIDILFLAGSLPIPVVSLLRPFLNLKIVFCEHENLEGRDKKSIIFRKIACKVSDKIVVLTRQTLEDYVNFMNIKKEKLIQIYNYIDYSDSNVINGSYNSKTKKIISVGRLSPEKGFDLAIEAAKEVFKKHSDWEWHIYGDGPDREKLLKKIKDYKLESNFILKGVDSNITSKYKEYSFCVLPSYREGFAVVLIEAKASGLPVLSFNCNAGPSEIVRDEVDGWLVTCYNTDEMAQKICKLIENPDIRKLFADNSRGNLTEFSRNIILKKWIKFIDEV